MDYSISELSRLSGVSPRALRYYEQLGLLQPRRNRENDYRVYDESQVDALQQILFYRELDVPLEEIGRLLGEPGYDRAAALEEHLRLLQTRQAQLDALIRTVRKTLQSMKGAETMTDHEKFEGFKRSLLADNEARYGAEVREKYGAEAAEASNARVAGMTEAQWAGQEALSDKICSLLRRAMETGDPAGPEAQQACEAHRDWLCLFWKPGTYSKAVHRQMGELYTADPRFRAYYEQHAGPGAADFLRSALEVYTR